MSNTFNLEARFIYLPCLLPHPGRGAKYFDQRVCFSVCPFVCRLVCLKYHVDEV